MVTLVEIKGLCTISGETVQQRAERIERDIVRHAEALDAKYPGSKVLNEKNMYGDKGRFLTLVTGSLGDCSADLLVVAEFIAVVKTVRALERRT